MKKFFVLLLASASLFAIPQAVVFDCGGVMTFPADHASIRQFVRESLQLPEAEVEKAEKEREQAIKYGVGEMQFWFVFAQKHTLSIPSDWLQRLTTVMKNAVRPNQEMYNLVNELKKQKIVVAMLSNVDYQYAEILRELGIYQPFDPCLLSCETGVPKPAPGAYKLLLQRLNLLPDMVVFIDDAPENVQAAQKIGIDGIVFHSPEQLRSELAKRSLL